METVHFGDLAVTYDPENKNLLIRHMRVEMQLEIDDRGASLVVAAQNSSQTQTVTVDTIPQWERVELRITPRVKEQ